MDPFVIDVIGWIGSALLIGAYLLTSMGKLSGTSVRYHLMNCAGAAAAAVNVLYHGALPVAVFEIAWATIGLVALARIARRQASDRARPNAR